MDTDQTRSVLLYYNDRHDIINAKRYSEEPELIDWLKEDQEEQEQEDQKENNSQNNNNKQQ